MDTNSASEADSPDTDARIDTKPPVADTEDHEDSRGFSTVNPKEWATSSTGPPWTSPLSRRHAARTGRELEQWREIKRTASDALMNHGTTITHHHAVGRVHREWYAEESPDGYRDSLREMKRVYDPDGIMNPGVLFEPET